ncbi:MAG: hypothetical protein FWE16_00800 [Firmicutes bacterium]|nr:hypothetical protein [Bacillota bacterium]
MEQEGKVGPVTRCGLVSGGKIIYGKQEGVNVRESEKKIGRLRKEIKDATKARKDFISYGEGNQVLKIDETINALQREIVRIQETIESSREKAD